jgi:O-antigen/teichoic acid export membrane protein
LEKNQKSPKKYHEVRAVVINLANLIYRQIFHEDMNVEVKTFLKNTLYVGLGTAVSTLCITIFTIMGGRLLGPEEYGKFSLIQSITMFLYVPMLFGYHNAMIKYVSEKEEPKRQSTIIMVTCILVATLTTISFSIILLFSRQISNLISTSNKIIIYSCILAALFVFYTIMTSILRSLNKMKTYSIFQSIYGTVLLIAFFFFILYKLYTFQSLLYPMFLGYGITGIIILIIIFKNYKKFEFDIAWAKKLTRFALFSVIGGLSYALYGNVDDLMISKFMSISYVGIYSAYYTASINVATLIWGIFLIVYFPTMSRYKDKYFIFKKINKIIPYIVIIGIFFFMICQYIILKFYGNKYPINISWMILFTIASLIIVVQGIYAWLLISTGVQGAKLVSLATSLAAIINVGLNIVLIPLIGITGAISSLIICFVFSIILVIYFNNKFLKDITALTD